MTLEPMVPVLPSGKKPWYSTAWGIAGIVSGIVVALSVSAFFAVSMAEPTPITFAFTAESMPEDSTEDTLAPVTYTNVDQYAEDMTALVTSYGEVMNAVSQGAFDVEDGVMTPADFALFLGGLIADAQRHLDQWSLTTPPPSFATFHQTYLEGLVLSVESLHVLRDAAAADDAALVDQANSMMSEANDKFTEAWALQPTG